MPLKPIGSLLSPLLLCTLTGCVYLAPTRLVVWLFILLVTATFLVGLALACLFVVTTLSEQLSWMLERRDHGVARR